MKMLQNLEQLWGNTKILNIMEQLVGPNIGGHPTYNLRFNTPDMNDGVVAYVPWHQGNSFTTNLICAILR